MTYFQISRFSHFHISRLPSLLTINFLNVQGISKFPAFYTRLSKSEINTQICYAVNTFSFYSFVLITRSALIPKVRAREGSLSLQITWKNGSCQLIQCVLPFFSKLERQISFPHPSPRSSLVREISRWFSSMRKKSQLQSSVMAKYFHK